MIIKIFLFQFVNSYASFFYLAFVADYVGDCAASGCMSSLAINLAIVFVLKLVVGTVMQKLLPLVHYFYLLKVKLARFAHPVTRPEREALLFYVSPRPSSTNPTLTLTAPTSTTTCRPR